MKESAPRSKRPPKDYREGYSTPYYNGLKAHGIRLPAALQLIRTDKARIEKPTDAAMWRNMFLTPRYDGCCNTIDTSSGTNLIMQWNTKRHISENSGSEE